MISTPPLFLSLHEWASLQTELLWIYDGVVLPAHRHLRTQTTRPGYWARYVRAGCVKLSTPSGVFEAGPGQWLTGERERGTIDASDDLHLLSIHFMCQWPAGDGFFGRTGVRRIEHADHPALRKIGEKLNREVRRRYPNARDGYMREQAAYPDFLQQQALFVQWLAVWCGTLTAQGFSPAYGGSGDERLTGVVRRLNEAPLAKGFPKTALLAQARLSAGQLDLRFTKAFGLSPWKYWERRKLEQAKRLLAQTDTMVKQIAYELGFKSSAHFIEWFHRLAKETPGRFRAAKPQWL